jgi:hypothetical protein
MLESSRQLLRDQSIIHDGAQLQTPVFDQLQAQDPFLDLQFSPPLAAGNGHQAIESFLGYGNGFDYDHELAIQHSSFHRTPSVHRSTAGSSVGNPALVPGQQSYDANIPLDPTQITPRGGDLAVSKPEKDAETSQPFYTVDLPEDIATDLWVTIADLGL